MSYMRKNATKRVNSLFTWKGVALSCHKLYDKILTGEIAKTGPFAEFTEVLVNSIGDFLNPESYPSLAGTADIQLAKIQTNAGMQAFSK